MFLNHQVELDRAASLDQLWTSLVEANKHLKIDGMELELDKEQFKNMGETHRIWCSNKWGEECNTEAMFKIELPLVNENKIYGKMILKKDMLKDYENGIMLQRIELLRRAIIRRLPYLQQKPEVMAESYLVKADVKQV
jgi:hypothetical protein